MAGTRTAPTVDGSPTFKQVSVTFYDYTGEQRTETTQIDASATDAQIEAYVAATQAGSNGSIWRVRVGEVYNSVGDPSNADEDVWEDIDTNVVILTKDAVNNSQDWFLPAPINAMFLDGSENIDPSNGVLGAWLTALSALRAGYSIVSGRFSQRRQIGTKINF